MAERVKCPRCRGTVGIPDNPQYSVTCPGCGELVLGVNPQAGTTWMPRKRWSGIQKLAACLVAWAAFWYWCSRWAPSLSASGTNASDGFAATGFWVVVAAIVFFAWVRRWI